MGRIRRQLPPVVITPELWGRILAESPGDTVEGYRNRALLHVLYYSGLRISEALALRGEDVDLRARTVRVRCGKGGKFRIAALPAPAADAVAPLIRRGLVFSTASGRAVLPSYVRSWMRRLAARVGVARLHAHGARHGHTLALVEAGVPIHLIRDDLGHSSVAVTDRYIQRVAPQRRIDAVIAAFGKEEA